LIIVSLSLIEWKIGMLTYLDILFWIRVYYRLLFCNWKFKTKSIVFEEYDFVTNKNLERDCHEWTFGRNLSNFCPTQYHLQLAINNSSKIEAPITNILINFAYFHVASIHEINFDKWTIENHELKKLWQTFEYIWIYYEFVKFKYTAYLNLFLAFMCASCTFGTSYIY